MAGRWPLESADRALNKGHAARRELLSLSAASSPQITHPDFTCGHASREGLQEEAEIKRDGFTPTACDTFDRSDNC